MGDLRTRKAESCRNKTATKPKHLTVIKTTTIFKKINVKFTFTLIGHNPLETRRNKSMPSKNMS